MWNNLASFIMRNRVWLLIAQGVLTLVFGYFATKVQLTYDFAKIIPKDDPDFIDYVKFKKTFGEDGNIMVIGIQSDKIFNLDFFNEWNDLSNSIENIEGVEKVLSITKLYNVYRNDSLRTLELKPILNRRLKTQHEVDSFKQIVEDLRFYRGLLYNPQTNVTLMAVTLKKQILDSKLRIPLVKEIENITSQFGKNHGTEIHYSGLPYVRTVFSSKVADEIQIFTYLSILITAIFIFLFFRFYSAVLYSLIVVIIGVISTLGTLAMFGYKITLLTGIIPPLMVIIGVQNCIYLLNVYHQEFMKHGNKMLAIIRLISKSGLPLFLTNFTTAIGFLVFSTSGSAILDEFAIIAGLNIMIIYALSLVFIPVVYSFLPPPPYHHTKHLDGIRLNKILDFCSYLIYNHRRSIYAFTLILVIISLFGATKIQNLGYVIDDIPHKDKVYKDLKFFESNLKGVLPFEIKIDTKKDDGVKDYTTLNKISRLQKELDKLPQLSRSVSAVDFLKFANQGMHQGDPRYYIIPNVLDIGEVISYLPKEKGQTNLMKSMVDSNYRTTRISVQMADIGSHDMKIFNKTVQKKIDQIFPKETYDTKITGTSAIFLKGNDYLIHNLLTSMTYALIIISLMMAFLFFSWKMVLISLLPSLIPLLMTLGIMGYFDIRLKPSTIIIFSITYGIVIDFCIHYLAKYRLSLKRHNWNMKIAIPESLQEAGPSIIYTGITLFFGFIIFSASNFDGTVALGVLTSIALVLGMLMNLLLLPSLLLSLEKQMNSKLDFESGVDIETDE